MRKFIAVLFSALLFAAPLSAQIRQGGAVKADGSESGSGSGTVTTTGTLAAGQVALGSGATSITGDAGLTYSGTGATFKLGIGTDVFLSRASAGRLLVEDGAGNARDLQARTIFVSGTSSPGVEPFGAYINGSPAIGISTGGHLYGAAANTRDIGIAGNEFRTGYFGTSVVTPVVRLTLATPTTSGDTCTAGTFWADASYLYVCTATNTIKRAALSAF